MIAKVLQILTTVCALNLGSAALAASPDDLEKQHAAIAKLVQESQRAGIERHDFDAYMAIWLDDAKLITARTKVDSLHDRVMTRGQIEECARIKYRAPAKGMRLTFSQVDVAICANHALLRYVSTLETKGSLAVAEEIFRLRKTDTGWKVTLNRYWPVEIRIGDKVVRYDAAKWARLDAEVERSRKDQDLSAQLTALMAAWRFKEAHAVAKKLTAAKKDDLEVWLMRGHAALEALDMKDALASFNRALEIDPKADVPSWAARLPRAASARLLFRGSQTVP
jgi:hypothetical protein